MPTPWPADGTNPWSVPLRAYIDAADGSNAYTLGVLAGNRAYSLSRIDVQTVSVVANPNTYIPVDTTASDVGITLPTGPADGTVVGVEYLTRASRNVVAIGTGTGDHFDTTTGPSLFYLLNAGQVAVFEYSDTFNVWHLIGGNVANLAPTDFRYERALKDDAGQQYTNTATETSLFTTALYDIPANSLAVGDLIEISAWGTYLNNSGAGRDLTIKAYLDAVKIGEGLTGISGGGIAANAAARSFDFRMRGRVVALGATGSLDSVCSFTVGGAGGVAVVATSWLAVIEGIIDTTQALTVDVKSTFSAATATQTLDCWGINVRKTPAP